MVLSKVLTQQTSVTGLPTRQPFRDRQGGRCPMTNTRNGTPQPYQSCKNFRCVPQILRLLRLMGFWQTLIDTLRPTARDILWFNRGEFQSWGTRAGKGTDFTHGSRNCQNPSTPPGDSTLPDSCSPRPNGCGVARPPNSAGGVCEVRVGSNV